MTTTKIYYGDALYDLVSANATVMGTPCVLLKCFNERAQKNDYTHITRNALRYLKLDTMEKAALSIHLHQLPVEDTEPAHFFYKLSDLIFFNEFYEFEDYVVGSVFNHRNEKIWDEKEMLQKLSIFGIQVDEILSNRNVLIKKQALNGFEKVKKNDYVLSDSEIEDFLNQLESDDALILKCALNAIGTTLVNTPTGVIRFKKEPLSEKEQSIVDDLNQAWIDYSDGKVSLREIIEARAKEQASVQYFFDSFAGCFYDEVENEEENDEGDEFEYVLKTEPEIKDLLKK